MIIHLHARGGERNVIHHRIFNLHIRNGLRAVVQDDVCVHYALPDGEFLSA